MNVTRLLFISALLTQTTSMWAATFPLASNVTPTNTLPGQPVMSTVRATAAELPRRTFVPSPFLTNSVSSLNSAATTGIPVDDKEIKLTPAGCEATSGRHKVSFAADIASDLPIVVTAPDGQIIAFRPTFLVLANRVTGENLLIAEVTNRIAQIIKPDRVVWKNAFDQAGPQIDIEYRYSSTGSLEQNIIFRHNPLKSLPKEWDIADVSIECWTETFFDSAAPLVESQTATLRPQSGGIPALEVEDQNITFNAMRIVAGGAAYSVGAERDISAVAKIWTQIEDQGQTRTFLIETLDAIAAKSKLDSLPETRRASAKPASNRAEVLRQHATNHKKEKDQNQEASAGGANAGFSLANFQYLQKESTAPMLLAQAEPSQPGVVLDFTIISSVPVPAGIISWWPACCTTNTAVAYDVFSYHNDGYLSNGVTYTAGAVGQGFYFGAYSNYIKIPNSTTLNQTNAFTIDAWVFFDKYGSNCVLAAKDNQAGIRQYLLTVSPQRTFRAHVGITNGNFYYIDSVTVAVTGVWTHVAMTYSATDSNLALYVNGALDTNATVSGSTITSTNALFIGGQPRGSPYWWSYNPAGKIDEVDLFGRALAPCEIQAIYFAGAAGKINPTCTKASTNAVGWWAGDNNLFDIAHTNIAVPFNGILPGPGMVDSAFNFDGVDDYIVVSNAPDLNPTNGMTLEAWIYLNSFDPNNWPYGNYPIISKDGCNYERQYLLQISGNQKVRGNLGLAGWGSYDGSTTIQPGAWYHVALTYNSTNSTMILYVNGVADLTQGQIGPAFSSSQPIFIGGAPHDCFPYYFPGVIDEPTIYNRTLTATEISAIYTAGCAGKCKSDSDNDGLSDLQEDWIGTDKTNPDTNGNGLLDGDEFFVYGLDPKAQAFKVKITRPKDGSSIP
jgi:hypothetical protein